MRLVADGNIASDRLLAPCLTPKQAALGRRIVIKYRRQLPAEMVAAIQGEQAENRGATKSTTARKAKDLTLPPAAVR